MQPLYIESKDPSKKRQYIIEAQDFIHYLGKGFFGYVVKCKCLDNGVEYAAKIIDYKKNGFPQEIYNYESLNAQKIRAYAKSVGSCINLVVAEDECVSPEQYFIIYPLFKKKDLRYLLTEMDQRLPESDAWELIRQVSNGLWHLHTKLKMIHRDLKIENIFVDEKEESKDGSRYQYYIGDFGLTRDKNDATTNCGSIETKAPEIQNGKYDTMVDIWSLGIILYYLLFGIYPFQALNNADLISQMKNGFYKIYLQQKVSEFAISFIESCLQRDPEERLAIDEIYKMLRLNELNKPFKIPYSLKHTFAPVSNDIIELSVNKGKKKYPIGPSRLLDLHNSKKTQISYLNIPLFLSIRQESNKEGWVYIEN